MANKRLDFIIFGATGFTGNYAVKNAVCLSKEYQVKFGVAGRKQEALEAIVKEFASDIEDVPIILADVKDKESLQKMTERAKVLINCCGPYRFYGEPVVKACIATRTHHVDVSGESQYMETMQLKYNKAAQEAGVYIVSACGFESIPADLGVIYAQKKFGGIINSIESYLNLIGFMEKSVINYGTWESAIYFLAHANELRDLRRKLYPERLPEFTPKLQSRGIHRSDISEGWTVSLLGPDRSVASHTQQFLYDNYKERPAQVETYITFKSFFLMMMVAILGVMMILMTRTVCTRNLLLKYPSIFTFGRISRSGKPKSELLARTKFFTIFRALGWSEKLASPTDKYTSPPNKELIVKISGSCPAYELTSIALILSAIMILKEADKMPNSGGVLPPGAAFGKTSLIDELNKHNMKFEVISSIEK